MVIQDAAPPLSAGDTAWVMVSSGLVLLMVPGLALFYGGLVRARAALNTFMMSFAALAVILVQWVLVGTRSPSPPAPSSATCAGRGSTG